MLSLQFVARGVILSIQALGLDGAVLVIIGFITMDHALQSALPTLGVPF